MWLWFWWLDTVLFQGNCQTEAALTHSFGSWCILDENFFSTSLFENLKFAAAVWRCSLVYVCLYCFCCSHFKYRGFHPAWAGLASSFASSQGLCCVTWLRKAKGSQERLKFWDEDLTLCWSLISLMMFFPALFGAVQEAYPWRYMLRVAGRKQTIIHAFPMACCRNLQKWALGHVFPTCGFCAGWKCVLKGCTSTPALYALLLHYVRWRALFGSYTYSAWFGLIWFCLLI